MSYDADLTLLSIMRRFPTDEVARTYFEDIRWPNGPVCPRCSGNKKIYARTANGKTGTRQGLYKCGECLDTFTVTVGTVMEGSKIPLRKWLLAFYMLCANKMQISTSQLQRQLELGSYRSALFLCQRIRYALNDLGSTGFVGGPDDVIESGETPVDGKKRLTRRRRAAHSRNRRETPDNVPF